MKMTVGTLIQALQEYPDNMPVKMVKEGSYVDIDFTDSYKDKIFIICMEGDSNE